MGKTEVRGGQIKDESITSADIGPNAVGNSELDNSGDFTVNSLAVSNGTVSLPSLTLSGDLNTGFFSTGADSLSITTGGIEALRIDSTQNLDFLQHEAEQLVVHKLSADPGSPVEGQIWYNTTDKQWKGKNDVAIIILG